MASTMQPPAPKPTKVVCQTCKRTTIVVTVAGERIAVDPEIISVVPYNGNAESIPARRRHAELCPTYARAEELRKLKIKRR